MAEAQWLLKEDGYINIDSDCSNIIYHPNLNIILVFSKHGYVDVLDVNSGVVLARTSKLSEETESIKGRYLPEQDRILFWDDKNIGLRGDYNNVLLLDTILQTPVNQIYDTVRVEILLSEAILVQQSLDNLEKHGLENTSEVVNELSYKIIEAQQNAKKKGIKAQKWETICLELPHTNLKTAASGIVMHLKRLDCHIPALAIASAINERLTDLFYGARLSDKHNPNTQRFHMFSEAARQQTFEQWPHMDYKWALPDQMAQAGFYYHPSKRGDDRAMCFTCNVCLVSWEKTDEPWSEHERHSADCPFVKGEYTQNVPLAITYATSPAIATNGFSIISNGDRGIIICSGNSAGEVIIWNVEKQLQNFHKFNVANDKKLFLTNSSFSDDENSVDVKLSALCTFKARNNQIHSINNNQSSNNYKKTLTMTLKSKIIGTKLICGINLRNNVDENVHGGGDTCDNSLLLVVYVIEDNNTGQCTNDSSNSSSNTSNTKNLSLSTKESLTSIQTNKKSSLCTIEEKSEDDFQYLSIYHLFSDTLPPSNKSKWSDDKSLKKTSSSGWSGSKDISSALQHGGPIISQESNPYFLGNTSSTMTVSDMSSTISSTSSLSTPNNEIICNPIQFVTFNLARAFRNLEITDIIPSYEYKNILVILKNQQITQLIVYNIDENGVIEENSLCDKVYDGITDSCPKEIIMLPNCDNNGRRFGGLDSEHGIMAMTCNNGSLNIVSLTTLHTISEVVVEKHKFVSLTYCKNLERLCGCTENGSLHFYSFFDLDAESSDGREDDNQYINMSDELREREGINKMITENDNMDKSKQSYDESKPSTSTSATSAIPNFINSSEIPTTGSSDIIAYKKSLTINDLKILYSLTLFDEVLTPYSAEVPGCWSKLVQAQKQRRQQHLQFGDDTHLTRTWRLHNDATTWDEHLIELSLPKMAPLGHIDFKFNLYKPCNNPPAIQVTLLKQKSIGLCFRRKTQNNSSCVDDNIDFNISSNDAKDSIENPVLNEEYLQAKNAEVIAGPIELSSCMDLSDQGGVVTLTGPKLLKTKGRNYLLHIKTMADLSKEGQGKTRGCDWLHEISITARSSRHVHKVTNERLQRISILESNLLLENLLKTLANNESYLQQNLSLDILIWIVTIRMSRYRSSSNKYRIVTDRNTPISEIASSDISVQQSECIEIVQKYLVAIIKNCILLNNRTIAHKCVKFLILSLDGAENMLYRKQYLDYEEAFMYAILINLPEMLKAEYSGALRWFTILISGTSTVHSQGPISEKCVQLLKEITSELSKRTNINNSLLSTRFGLYGLPFESEIFDTELPILVKNNPTFAYAAVLKTNCGSSQVQQNIQLHSNKGFSTASDQAEPKKLPFQLNIGNHFKGLLEVEPLHFVCCAATEATRLENVESGNLQTTNIIDDILLETPSQNTVETVHMSQGTAKKDSEKESTNEDMMNNVKNILVDKIFHSAAFKKNMMKEKMKLFTGEVPVEGMADVMTDTGTTPPEDWLTTQEPRVVYLTPNNSNDDNIDSILDGVHTTSTSASLTNKIQEFFDDTTEDLCSPFPWHKLLNSQPRQMIVVDRMHSGARRHITLDFGSPILLTDIVFPACSDVACISIDVWCFEEDADSVRLVVSNDIGIKTLVLSDLQPPPICRYMKITFTGRYGMSATRCRIPIGLFYGHVIVLEKEGYADHVMKYIRNKKSNAAVQLKALNSLFEDVHCRYCLSSSKLSELLKPLLNGEASNISHIQAFLNKSKDNAENSAENSKIIAVYEECISFQNQLNIIQRVVKRLEQTTGVKSDQQDKILTLSEIYTDKLRFLSECMIEMLLHFIITYGSANINEIHSLFDLETCNLLFDTLVIEGDTQIQLATCSLLVKMSCFQPWWGDFFSNIFTKLYSSQNSKIFPQDRVFFFLTYLGRKSISMGTCRSIVIDAILKSIATLLVPLSRTYNQGMSLWSTTDLNLLGWLLLFLSVCLDGVDKKDQSQSKWDFMSGEADMVKSRLSLGNNSLRTLTRSLKKRFIQKQHYSSNVAEKFFMMSSDQMAQNTSQLEIAIKQHESQLKKLHNTVKLSFGDYLNDMVKTKMIIVKPNDPPKPTVNNPVYTTPTFFGCTFVNNANNANNSFNYNNVNYSTSNSSVNVMNHHINNNNVNNHINIGSNNNMQYKSSSNNNINPVLTSQSSSQQHTQTPLEYAAKADDPGETAFDKGLKSINSDNILVVVRGLIGLILNMDFTCNMDLFLLTCKIIARLVLASHPSNSLSKLMTTTQLLQLVRIAVWENQQQPWAVHAITCLLQDILAADKRVSNNNSNNIVEIDNDAEMIDNDDLNADFKLILSPQVTKDMSYAEAVKFQLPSLLECDDAEMEDLLEDFLERDKKGLKKDNLSSRGGITTILYRTISSAMDARLEYGIDTNIEITLRRLTMKSSLNLCATLPQISMSETIHATFDLEPWPENIVQPWSGSEYNQEIRTNTMLTEIFDNIFSDLHMESSWLNLEKILELWLTLNVEAGDQVLRRSKIPFGERAVCGLLKALATHPSINLRAWCLGFQCLIYACKQFFANDEYLSNENGSRNMDSFIVNNEYFQRMLNRFFSGSDKANASLDGNRYAGPSICKLVMEFFVCCNLQAAVREKQKEILLQVLLHLIQYDGAISIQQGPIDAQSRLIKELLTLQYEKTDLGVAMSIIESVSNLVYNNIANVEKVYCQKSSETNNNSNVFGSLFATVLGPENSRKCKTVTDSTLLVDLLKLSSILILTRIPRSDHENLNTMDEHNLSSESQTDETKVAEQLNEPKEKPLCFADTVLQHSPTMTRFFGSLSQCSNSLFAMLVASSMYTAASTNEAKNALGEPRNVSDALFQLLIYLSKTSTKPDLVIKPLFDFISYATSMRHAMPKLQLSEPFLWFILEVLETPTSVKLFTDMGGIQVLCESLVRSNRCLINTKPSLVSMIMQRFISRSSPLQASLPGTSTSKKASANPVKNDEGLINFAPYCSISSEIGTAQPVDVLIQAPIASHRRARNPAWSYLFYPKEAHVDLKITLPTAVLLKEIQLQPHLSTLASCPSAVAIEITRDNNLGPIPITQPVSTVGMTCIRLRLSQPEIATSVVIRLYRPKDSSSIGLTQILLLGTTTFNDNTNNSTVNALNGNTSISNPGIANQSTNENLFNDDDSITKTSFGWLRILAQCFNVASYDNNNTNAATNIPFIDNAQLLNDMVQSASSVNGFLEACCSLLNIGSLRPTLALQNLETVLLKIGLHSVDLGLKLIDNLLKESIPQTFKMCNESVSDLLYHLCTAQDNFTRTRIEAMLIWLRDLRTQFDSDDNLLQATNPYSGFIKCLSSILWQAYATNLILDLPNLITKELFESLYNWLTILDADEPLKISIDAMLCSLCCIRPELFTVLLKKMKILIPNLSTDLSACISDDQKDCDSNNSRMTDDIKQEESDLGEWYSHLVIQDLSKLSLTRSQLNTIALACQSPLAIQLLIDSGLPNLLTSAILEFCHRTNNDKNKLLNLDTSPSSSSTCLTDSDKAENNNKMNPYPMISIEKIREILDFFTEICAEGHMRDWLGSFEGSIFWESLLVLLCNNKFYNNDTINSLITPQPYLELEESVIKFLSAVTSCHPKNQNTLSICLIAVIRKSDDHILISKRPSSKVSISSFTRRLVLQILLESEKIVVSVRSDLPLQRKETSTFNNQSFFISNHPSKRPNSHYLLFYLSANSKCQEILENYVSLYNNILPSVSTETRNSSEASKTKSLNSILRDTHKELYEMGMGMEFLSVAAGVTAKDKRLKEAKNQAATMKAKDFFSAFKLNMDDTKSLSPDSAQLTHSSCPDVVITSDTTIAQILAMLKYVGFSLSTPCINLNIVQGVKQQQNQQSSGSQSQSQSDHIDMDSSIKAADFLPLPSPLQIFSSRGGLSLLAHYLPTVYPEASKSQQQLSDKDKSPPVSEWVKVEQNEEIYEDLDDTLVDSTPRVTTISSVPQHSLSACGLFLKLPAYSEVLIRDKVRAQCLLRLILGVTGDGEGNEIYSLALSSSLPTLPFEVFRQLLDSSPLTTDDGVLLRRKVIEIGAIHLVLSCLGIFTHHSSHISGPQEPIPTATGTTPTANKASGTSEDPPSDDKSHVYWAKGTGFGTGSTQQSWNVEQALLRQKSEEEHVTILLQVLSSYINPGDKIPTNSETEDDELNYRETNETLPELPPIFLDFLQQSCLIPALCSYLSNDSVLDITRHIPLYRAILQLLRAISLSNQLITLLMTNQNRDCKTSIASLLLNMKACVDTYASRLKFNKKTNGKTNVPKMSASFDDSDDEGLALLIPDIQETAVLVQSATTIIDASDKEDDDKSSIDYPIKKSLEEKYLEIIKKLQFDSYDMIKETESESGFRFTISHHFETNVRMAGERGHPQRVKRLAQEAVTLSTSLPLSYSSSVFVRYDTDRLDIMKVLITGPADTPYANGCFEFDIYFPTDYPNAPMMINLETTGKHSVRFNPNLYNDGKVCLSVLNTWHGRPEEKWNAQTSSFLQVLVSIQSLILVPEPYFNEPGFERSRGTPSGSHSSREYNSNIYQACVRWAMLEQLKNPCPCFKEVIHTHFWLKRNEICTQIEGWIAELSKPQQNERSGRTLSYNANVLRRQYRQLREELAKLPVPEGLEDFDNPFTANLPTTNTTSMLPSTNINTVTMDTLQPCPASPPLPASPASPPLHEQQSQNESEHYDDNNSSSKDSDSSILQLAEIAMMNASSMNVVNDLKLYKTILENTKAIGHSSDGNLVDNNSKSHTAEDLEVENLTMTLATDNFVATTPDEVDEEVDVEEEEDLLDDDDEGVGYLPV